MWHGKAHPGLPRASGNRRSRPRLGPQDDLCSLKLLWIEPTSACNLECVHCYSSAGASGTGDLKDVLTFDQWVDVLAQGAEIGCKIVQIGGGEPTLFDGLVGLVEKARELGYRNVVLFTNATLLSESDLDELAAYNVEIVTSFYSNRAGVHDAITQRLGSFERTVAGIRSLLDTGLQLEVSVVRMPQNEDHVEDVVDFLAGLGVDRRKIAVGPVRAAGRAATPQTKRDPFSCLCGRCTARHLVVTGDGSVYPCLLARWSRVGDVRSEKLLHILAKPELTDFRLRTYAVAPEPR